MILAISIILVVAFIALNRMEPEYAYMPPEDKIINTYSKKDGYDRWGQFLSEAEAHKTLSKTELSEKNGTIKVDERFRQMGRESFYKETFGNEVFFTDIVGIVDGPLTLSGFMKAIMKLKGEGTTNLKVQLSKDAVIGGRTFKKGETVDTGIDVAKGTFVPIGMPVKFSEGRVKIGISCAACHATVDRDSKKIIEGAPNQDLNAGLLLALAPNSAAYFTHAQISSLKDYIQRTEKEQSVRLPDQNRLEEDVDRTFLQWPKGNFDSTIDMKSNPAQIPDSFTMGDHPFGWSGFAQAGSFKGLSTFNNNVHAQNADALSQLEASKALFNIDKEIYLGTILQNAANEKYRYNFKSENMSPSQFFDKVDPTPGAPGVNELVKPPHFPKVSLIAPDGLIASAPGYKVNEQNNAMSAFQNSILPPKYKEGSKERNKERNEQNQVNGREVFNRAGCISCHAGAYLTNNQIVPANEIQTEPSRANALEKTETIFGEAMIQSPNTPVPVPKDARVLQVPTGHLNKNQLLLGFAHGNSPGGYKVPSLIGLNWTAPYLHDGGVAAGTNIQTELGLSGTVQKNIPVDPRSSLRALLDRQLRQKVIEANQELKSVHVTGQGHEFWVDKQAGFTKEEQDALLDYLLSVTKPQE
jgi:hypothetical protein